MKKNCSMGQIPKRQGLNTDIAMYMPSLRGGGAERVMLTLANGFAAQGLAVDLVLVEAIGPYLDEVAPGVRVVNLGKRRVLTSLPALIRYLREMRPQVMLSALNHANVIAILARSLAQVPTRLVVSEHNNVSLSERVTRSLSAIFLLPLMRWTYPFANGVVAVSGGVADDLARVIDLRRSSISAIYNPIYTDKLLELANSSIDQSWFNAGEPPVVLGVGRLNVQKDFPTLIRAFAKVRAQRRCRLIILGEGELRSELESLVIALGLSDDVALPGFKDNPYPWMRRASLFVLSSAWEGFGNVLVEAMACGTPVVSTNCPSGPAEILEDGRWGRLVPVGDVDALTLAMLATLEAVVHPDVRGRAQNFGVEKSVARYLDVMKLAQ